MADGRATLVAEPELRLRSRSRSNLEAEPAEDCEAVTIVEPSLRQVMPEHGVGSALEGEGKFPGSPDVGDAVQALLYQDRLVGRLRELPGGRDGPPPGPGIRSGAAESERAAP